MENDSSAANIVFNGGRLRSHRKILARVKKKLEFLANLNTNLDTLIYVELCIVYYMDCSFFRLVLRLVNQMIFFTPKPVLLRSAPRQRPYLGAIFIPGLICLLLHIFTARSEASEVTRGYLHGGIIIDLIGQKGPTSKLHLLILDVLLLLVQCLMLAVALERERLQLLLTALTSSPTLNLPASPQPPHAASPQDHDAEERGVFRADATHHGSIEVPNHVTETSPASNTNTLPILSETDDRHANETHEQTRLLAPHHHSEEDEDADETLDLFWSGMACVADFHILHNLKMQWRDYGNATGMALQTVGYSAELAALTANRRINAATARLQQGVLSPRIT